MERFAKLAARSLNNVLSEPPINAPVTAIDLEIPPDFALGDFAFPCFRLAKQMKTSPQKLANDFAADERLRGSLPEGISVSVAGPYVNFTVSPSLVMKEVLRDILSGDGLGAYGKISEGTRGTWVLEYSSPNVAKPLNIYHLRPTALGAAMDRVGRFRGFNVISINHLGDWGKQYGLLAVAFRLFGKNPQDQLKMEELVDMYVKVNAEARANPAIEEEAKAAFVRLEQGDAEMTALWKKCVDISMAEFNRAYQRLGVTFDHVWGESHYKDMTGALLEELRAKGLLILSEGAWIVPVKDAKGQDLPPCILVKSDGATIYATRDLAAAKYRFEKFKFDRMTYIVGAEQKLHFQQVFAVLSRMGSDWASRCEHVPTGLYRFKDKKMSTREGNYITLESVIDMAKERVREIMRARGEPTGGPIGGPTGGIDENVAEAVGVGAVVFNDLHTDPARDVDFDVNRVVDFEGETGPYLQYAHTRCLGILRKARESGELGDFGDFGDLDASPLTAPQEVALAKILGQFPLHLERTLTFSKASQLAIYLIDVAKAFGAFYRESRVLGGPRDLTRARLAMVEAVRRILARGLTLLGVPLPERM